MNRPVKSWRFPVRRTWRGRSEDPFFATDAMRGYMIFKRDAIGMPRQFASAKTKALARAAVRLLTAEYEMDVAKFLGVSRG